LAVSLQLPLRFQLHADAVESRQTPQMRDTHHAGVGRCSLGDAPQPRLEHMVAVQELHLCGRPHPHLHAATCAVDIERKAPADGLLSEALRILLAPIGYPKGAS